MRPVRYSRTRHGGCRDRSAPNRAVVVRSRAGGGGAGVGIAIGDFLPQQPERQYAAVVGNPPYVRYQDFSGAARAAGIRERDIGSAGLKDKHAVTTQWLSLPAAGNPVEIGFMARTDGTGGQLQSIVGAALSEIMAPVGAAQFASQETGTPFSEALEAAGETAPAAEAQTRAASLLAG